MVNNKDIDMKVRNIILLFLYTLGTMTSCAEHDKENNLAGGDIKEEYMTFSAVFQNDETKTTLDGNPDDLIRNLMWQPDDEVYVCGADGDGEVFRNITEENSTSAMLQGVAMEESCYYAFFPAGMMGTFDDRQFRFNLPSEQIYEEAGMARDAFPMVAYTENSEMHFRNLCGMLVVNIYGEGSVSSIEFVGYSKDGNPVPVSGAVCVDMTETDIPVLSMTEDALSFVTLLCEGKKGNGVALSMDKYTSFHLVLPPMYCASFDVKIELTNGSSIIKHSDKPLEITRSHRTLLMPFEYTMPDDEIWYETTDGKILDVYSGVSFGDASLLSNCNHGGFGVLKFDKEVREVKKDRIFYLSETLTSLAIPDSVIGFDCAIVRDSPQLKELKGQYVTDDGRCMVVDGLLVAFAPKGASRVYHLPECVEIVPNGSLHGDDVEALVLNEGLLELESFAISMTSLEKITLPESLVVLGDAAVCCCPMLHQFIGKYASDNGRFLIDGTRLKGYAGAGLSACEIPEAVDEIGCDVFMGCTEMTKVSIHAGVKYICEGAFYACEYLKNVYFSLSSDLLEIGEESFAYCIGLTSVTIPANVTSIGRYAFVGCENLSKVTMRPPEPPQLGEDAFFGVSDELQIRIGSEYLAKYKADGSWYDYVDYMVAY